VSQRSARRQITIVTILSLAFSLSSFSISEAAVKSGASCSKVNAKTKIGGDAYVCTKNPTVKNAKLTWVWVGCMQSNTLYVESKKRLTLVLEKAAAANLAIDNEIANLKASAASDEAEAKVFDQKAADAKAKQASAIVEAKSASDKANAVGPTTAAGINYSKASQQWTKAANSYGLAVSNFERSATNLRKKIGEVANLEKKKVTVQRSVESAKTEVDSSLQNRKNACEPGL
jgi:hypothetical protein